MLTDLAGFRGLKAAGVCAVGADAECSHMASIELPSLPGVTADSRTADSLNRHLQKVHGVQVPVSVWEGRLWVRVSAQIYNTLGDYQALADAIFSHRAES